MVGGSLEDMLVERYLAKKSSFLPVTSWKPKTTELVSWLGDIISGVCYCEYVRIYVCMCVYIYIHTKHTCVCVRTCIQFLRYD